MMIVKTESEYNLFRSALSLNGSVTVAELHLQNEETKNM